MPAAHLQQAFADGRLVCSVVDVLESTSICVKRGQRIAVRPAPAAATSAAAAAAGRAAAASVLCAGARRPARSAAVSAPEPPFAAVPARPPAARPTLA